MHSNVNAYVCAGACAYASAGVGLRERLHVRVCVGARACTRESAHVWVCARACGRASVCELSCTRVCVRA